jgi:hypothetical protein
MNTSGPRSFRMLIRAGTILALFLSQSTRAAEDVSTGTKSLKLTIEIVGQRHCFPDSEGPILYLDLLLRFTNLSQHPVILSKRIETPPIIRAAQSLEDAKAGKFDYSPNLDFFVQKLPPAPPSFGKAPNPKQFAVLAPGDPYETTIPSGFWTPVNSHSSRRAYGFLPGSVHAMQVGVDTWPYDWPNFVPANARKVSARWATVGDLAYGLLYSEFVSFEVPESFENVSCEGSRHR